MRAILKLSDYPNMWGSFASGLCLVHCMATPFLFAAHTGHLNGHHSHPFWWGFIDVFFIFISLLAIYWSVKNTSKRWMKFALWISWTLLFGIILNEKIQIIEIADELIYLPSMALILLHIYNRKYCRCPNKNCCLHEPN